LAAYQVVTSVKQLDYRVEAITGTDDGIQQV